MINKNDGVGKSQLEQVAKNVFRARHANGWSLGDLALKTGLSKSFLSTMEAGKSSPNLQSLAAIAGVLDCTVGELIEQDMYALCGHCGGMGYIRAGSVKIQGG